jgi:hypothetical protein
MTARIIRIATLVVITFGALVAVGPATATTSAGTDITITGRIADPDGYPLGGVTVRLFDNGPDDGSVVATATTNEVGRFRFPKAPSSPADTYWLVADDQSGYHRSAQTQFFTAEPGQTTTRNLTMKNAGIIQGIVRTKVRDEPSRPAKHVEVWAEGTKGGNSVKVSANGRFRLGGLPTGVYTLTFEDTTGEFATTCYDDVLQVDWSCPEGTATVKVTAGRVTTIDKQVLDQRHGVVSGTVTDADGAPLEGVVVGIHDTEYENDDLCATRTAADGEWTCLGLTFVGKITVKADDPSGTYRDTWFEDAADFAHATALRLKDHGEIDDVTIAMPTR